MSWRGPRSCRVCLTTFTPSAKTHFYCSGGCLRRNVHIGSACPVPWRECRTCSSWFVAHPSNQVVCSRACRLEEGRQRFAATWVGTPTRAYVCQVCGVGFERQGRHGRPQYCSSRCAVRSDTARARKRRTNAIRKARQVGVRFERFDDRDVFARDNWCCQICGLATNRAAHHLDPDAPTLDHVIALARGGDHTLANVQTAHRRCNERKGAGDNLAAILRARLPIVAAQRVAA